MSSPEIIGTLAGCNVLLDRERQSVIVDAAEPIRFHVDHPYIQGTKLERDARAALAKPKSDSEPECMYGDNGKVAIDDTCLKCKRTAGQDCGDV